MFFSEYGALLVLGAVGLLFPLGAICGSWLLSRWHLRLDAPDPVKDSPYECGMESSGPAWVQFNFRYYLYALVFVVIDIEAVFLYPWAATLRQLEIFGLIEMAVFVAILALGLAYGWRKRALEWM